MFNPNEFVIGGVLLLPFVFGLTEFLKSILNIEGKNVTIREAAPRQRTAPGKQGIPWGSLIGGVVFLLWLLSSGGRRGGRGGGVGGLLTGMLLGNLLGRGMYGGRSGGGFGGYDSGGGFGGFGGGDSGGGGASGGW